jgi:hypothetical protein
MTKKQSSLILGFASLLVLVPSLRAQAVYSADKKSMLQVGAGVLYLKPDYVDTSIEGASIWADYDFRRFIGVEADIHIGSIITPSDISENSYFVGPRFMYHRHKITAYGKFLFGRATITNQDNNQSSSYNAYAFGGGVEYRIMRKINIRVVDFELQQWPNFEPNTLSPLAISIGASYIIK